MSQCIRSFVRSFEKCRGRKLDERQENGLKGPGEADPNTQKVQYILINTILYDAHTNDKLYK